MSEINTRREKNILIPTFKLFARSSQGYFVYYPIPRTHSNKNIWQSRRRLLILTFWLKKGDWTFQSYPKVIVSWIIPPWFLFVAQSFLSLRKSWDKILSKERYLQLFSGYLGMRPSLLSGNKLLYVTDVVELSQVNTRCKMSVFRIHFIERELNCISPS